MIHYVYQDTLYLLLKAELVLGVAEYNGVFTVQHTECNNVLVFAKTLMNLYVKMLKLFVTIDFFLQYTFVL